MQYRRLTPFLVGLSLFGAGKAAATGTCASYDAGTQVGTITDTGVNEASGVVASFQNPGVYWTHNDSGNSGDVIALAEDGSVVARFSVANAFNVDWEDIALGPCPDACACLFIADMGDNLHFRGAKTIYRFPEPVIGLDEGSTQDAEPLQFVYPDNQHWDAETLIVDPHLGDMYIVTKDYDVPTSLVYKMPARPTASTTTVTQVGQISFAGLSSTIATGGDAASDGGRVVVRTLSHALEFQVPTGGAFETAFSTTPKLIPLPASSQGEAIGYTPDGMGLITVSENVPSPVYRVSCTSGTAITDPALELSTACEPVGGCRMVNPNGLNPFEGQGHLSTGLVIGSALLSLWRRHSRKKTLS